jgi:ABC-2 type transport system ATP-binding protein
MTSAISVDALSRKFRGQLALDNVSFNVESHSITGLLGRNGAGKTTLLRIVAGNEFATSGKVTVDGADPATNDVVLRHMVFVREDQAYPEIRVGQALLVASWFYPNWDSALASSLLDEFNLPVKRRVKKLSRGMRSALGILIGLAARADVTLFDEPYAGLDPVARQIFYDRLLAEYADYPRTILLSTHLIDEAAGLLNRVVVLDKGRLVLDAETDDLRGAATSVSGPIAAVEEFCTGRTVWNRQPVAAHETAVVAGAMGDDDRARAVALHVTLEPQTLQQVVVHAARANATDTLERTNA